MFYSDNTSAVHPRVLDAINRANSDAFAASYGEDELSRRVRGELCETFGAGLAQFTATGTGANVLGLFLGGASRGRVLTSSIAHLRNDEAGAPERSLGCQIQGIASETGILTADMVRAVGRGDAYQAPLAVVVISQATEHGVCYSLSEIGDLADAAHAMGARLHVDGARLANACCGGGAMANEYRELFAAGVDTLSFSGTKNGAMAAEVLLVAPGLCDQLALERAARSLGNLQAKSRFVAAQFDALLEDDLWLENAAWANTLATRISVWLAAGGVEILYPTMANEVFARVGAETARALEKRHWASIWQGDDVVRLVTSWSSTFAQVKELLSFVEECRRGE